ncbi:integral membrane sensor signal transduction histidine kinase [Pseudopedobacter saltans DSM 12145]|uniref:histidine kinase n=1 Tax=Pseudopedobacter saltans (strain ATCC 51119 / DSM 12145 / JCM 21818 / CCUG 39354 / LMG 10337 / NBRC 100064 / NCIMB 13643) TaxID=762903 RepID=F0SBQ5_PSESL|nr:HAMP domain-containing sensor histidine kinase [Pseudopedobacter saltans]ADY52746.1 integral membrane sensor signal transduction histidine kinase [Pseudopedobacter saltans DSM 12145]
MTKLLSKPLKAFTLYALCILLASIPVYYFIIDQIWTHELNKHNEIVSSSIIKNLENLHLNNQELESSIALWNKMLPDTKISHVEMLRPDSIYDVYRKSAALYGHPMDRFHGLVTYFSLDGKNYSLTVETNIEESYETIAAITVITVIFFSLILVGFIQLNKRISGSLWKPFYETLEKIKNFDIDKQQPIDFKKSEFLEFEEMNHSISRLIESNLKAYNQQKEFTENASHELQTPLAIIQSKLDILQNSSIDEEQFHIIEEAGMALTRASRINKNLLLLARIENQQFPETEEISINESLDDLLSLLSDFLKDKILKLDSGNELIIHSNKTLLDIMLTNLMMNAIRHTKPNSEIQISLYNRRLSISNTGDSPLEEEKLFRRFSTVNKNKPGSGLGLSIVKEIAKRYHWEIAYSFQNSMHTFTIDF